MQLNHLSSSGEIIKKEEMKGKGRQENRVRRGESQTVHDRENSGLWWNGND